MGGVISNLIWSAVTSSLPRRMSISALSAWREPVAGSTKDAVLALITQDDENADGNARLRPDE